MAKDQSSIDERTANLRDVQGSRAGKTKTLSLTPRSDMSLAEIVKKEIIRVLGNDRRLALAGAEFLLSMGMLVKDPSDRAQVLTMSLPWTMTTRRR
jgi:hypothetical protein